MNRADLENYICETYPADSDFPWMKYPSYQVFRHSDSKKWFALIMDVPQEKLGLSGKELLDVVNFKTESAMLDSFLHEPGIFPAYHMNKSNWLSVALDGSVDEDKIKLLLEISFNLTDVKPKKTRI